MVLLWNFQIILRTAKMFETVFEALPRVYRSRYYPFLFRSFCAVLSADLLM